MPLAEKGVRGKGQQPLSPPQHTETWERDSAPVLKMSSYFQSTLQAWALFGER